MTKIHQHAIWGRRGTFILAATGSAVGLGNIWKFPYITGENGGGAFVVMYLLCICLIGLPVMAAEVMLGRRGRASPIIAMQRVVRESKSSRLWVLIGWSGVLAGFIILSYYSVIAGWTLEYVTQAARGGFSGFDGASASAAFGALQGDISTLVQWQTAFLCMTALVIMFGVTRGLETAVRILMPLLFALLLILLGYAAYAGDFAAGFSFLFNFRVEELSLQGLSLALGHAFFTLSLSMGAMMAYGSYMPHNQSILKTVVTVGVLDTAVALLAGLVIFPIVFANPGVEPGAGPGLMFVSLPIVFGAMPFGEIFGTVFFILVTVAAWSSTISLLEPAVAYLTERFRFHRVAANLLIVFCAWLLGLTTVFSLNRWQDLNIVAGMTPFDVSTFVTEQVLLPLGALGTAIYVGWFMSRRSLRRELAQDSSTWFVRWLTVLKYVSPVLIAVVFVLGLYGKFSASMASIYLPGGWWGFGLVALSILSAGGYVAWVSVAQPFHLEQSWAKSSCVERGILIAKFAIPVWIALVLVVGIYNVLVG